MAWNACSDFTATAWKRNSGKKYSRISSKKQRGTMKLVIITRPVTAHTVVTLVEDYPNNLLTNQEQLLFIFLLSSVLLKI